MPDAAAAGAPRPLHPTVGLVLLAAAGTFALTMGVRQSMGLFLGDLNTATGLGIVSVSLAFAFGQLWWGLTQPFAGAAADRFGAAPVLLAGVSLVALGTALTPFMTSTLGLVFAIGVLAAGGAGMAGPSVLMAATTRLLPPARRGMATAVVNLDPAVERARAGRHRTRWQGANRSDGVCHREDSQRGRRVRGRLDRARSALTQPVRAVVSAIARVHAVLQAEASGQLPDLGSMPAARSGSS